MVTESDNVLFLNFQITIERESGEDVSSPKHGKEDPDNMPHVGGNTWAGGTGWWHRHFPESGFQRLREPVWAVHQPQEGSGIRLPSPPPPIVSWSVLLPSDAA